LYFFQDQFGRFDPGFVAPMVEMRIEKTKFFCRFLLLQITPRCKWRMQAASHPSAGSSGVLRARTSLLQQVEFCSIVKEGENLAACFPSYAANANPFHFRGVVAVNLQFGPINAS
jgi:hypothetical protein